ncbi:MAG TPA: SemiSWEET transporter [Flavobacteriaceae bacterium]|nr:SemiSWEET transporter [Flavobacteriaceae bacterium]
MDIWIDVLGLVAGFCTTLAVTPQIRKALRTKEVEDVSPKMYMVLMTGLALWTIYGALKTDWPIIIANGIAFLLNSWMLYLWFRYKR